MEKASELSKDFFYDFENVINLKINIDRAEYFKLSQTTNEKSKRISFVFLQIKYQKLLYINLPYSNFVYSQFIFFLVVAYIF